MAAAAAIMANYEIGHNLKSIQLRDPMKLSFAFSKFKMAAIFETSHLFARCYTLWEVQIDGSILY